MLSIKAISKKLHTYEVLRSFVDIQIYDSKNVDIQIYDSKNVDIQIYDCQNVNIQIYKARQFQSRRSPSSQTRSFTTKNNYFGFINWGRVCM
jgi:hypothetical protein